MPLCDVSPPPTSLRRCLHVTRGNPLPLRPGRDGSRRPRRRTRHRPKDLAYRRDKAVALAHSQRLAHTVGVNGFFTDLAAACRSGGRSELVEWWSERRCAATWGHIVRPDGYGRWREGPREVDFFLEYDRGTEPLNRLVDKLNGYADLQAATGITTTWVLLRLPGSRREAALRKLLRRAPVSVATGHPLRDYTPADALWLPRGATQAPRQRPAALQDRVG